MESHFEDNKNFSFSPLSRGCWLGSRGGGRGYPRQTSLVIMSFGVDLCRRIMFSGICVLAGIADAEAAAGKKDTKGFLVAGTEL